MRTYHAFCLLAIQLCISHGFSEEPKKRPQASIESANGDCFDEIEKVQIPKVRPSCVPEVVWNRGNEDEIKIFIYQASQPKNDSWQKMSSDEKKKLKEQVDREMTWAQEQMKKDPKDRPAHLRPSSYMDDETTAWLKARSEIEVTSEAARQQFKAQFKGKEADLEERSKQLKSEADEKLRKIDAKFKSGGFKATESQAKPQ